MNTWTIHKILAFNGLRGIAEDLSTGDTVQFHIDQIKPQDVRLVKEGQNFVVTEDGYMEHSGASFRRMYL